MEQNEYGVTRWDAITGTIQAATRMLENRRDRASEAPITLRAALAGLDREMETWRGLLTADAPGQETADE